MNEFESLKHHAARKVYKKELAGDNYTPKGQRWRDWFTAKYGEDYSTYIRKMMELKQSG